MAGYVLRRLLVGIPVLFGVSVVAFLIVRLAPGDPAALLADFSQLSAVQQDAFRQSLGLNEPLPVQYVAMARALLTGELTSLRSGEPVVGVVLRALPVTLSVVLPAIVIGLLVGVAAGVFAATHRGSVRETAIGLISLVGVAVPSFWLGLWAITIFATQLHLLPAGGFAPVGMTNASLLEVLPHLVLPTAVLSLGTIAVFHRYSRAAVGEALRQDFVRTAHAKGLPRETVLIGHVLRASLVTVVSVGAGLVPILLSTSVVVETVFGLPGLGQVAVTAALTRDYPVVLAASVVAATLVLLSSLAADVLYGAVDPRIRVHD